MILHDFKAFPRHGRIMAVDWGAARTGLAISDEGREFVFVRPVIPSRDVDAALRRIVDTAQAENAVGIVMGLPLRGDGSESDTTTMVRAVATQLAQMTDLPIYMLDETLTSYEAATRDNIHTRRAAREKLDSASARVLLENAIAMLKRCRFGD